MIDSTGREEAADHSGENVAESIPPVIDSFYLIDSDILSKWCMGQ